MAYKYEDAFQLMRDTAMRAVGQEESWKEFLASAAMNYKRPFHNQLLIYAQKPEATACATFDYWNKRMGRFVKKGSKGIVTLDMAGQNKEILFDISDTGSRSDVPVPIWKVTDDMYAPLGMALQEHFESAVSSGDLVAVLLEVGDNAARLATAQVVDAIRGCRENSLLSGLDGVSLERVVSATLGASVQFMLLKRCGLDSEAYTDGMDFSHIARFNTYDTIAVLGSSMQRTTNGLLKDISLAARSIEKIIALSENKNKEVEYNGVNVYTAGGLSGSEHISAEAGDELREVRHSAENVSDEREDRGVHSPDYEGRPESAPERDRQEGDGARDSVGSADGAAGGRDGRDEGIQSDEMGGLDEQLPERGRGDRADGDDLHLTDADASAAIDGKSEIASENGAESALENGYAQVENALGEEVEGLGAIAEGGLEVGLDSGSEKDLNKISEVGTGYEQADGSALAEDEPKVVADGKQPDLSLEYVLTNVLQYHKYLSFSGAEIQNFFLDHEGEGQKAAYLHSIYNKDYTELLTPGDGYRVGYHANDQGLEVWTGAYLGSNSRVTVSWGVVANIVDVLIYNDQYLTLSEKVEIPSEEKQAEIADVTGVGGEGQVVPDGVSDLTDTAMIQNALAVSQQVIDEVLCSGSNKLDSIYTICAYYKREHSAEENVQFLADVYGTGTGKGFIIDGKPYSAVFVDGGIRIAEGKGVSSAEETAFLPWRAVDKRVRELLRMGRYMSASDYALVEEKLWNKAANELWLAHREILTPEIISSLSLKAFEELPLVFNQHNFTEDRQALWGVLVDYDKLSALLDETKVLIDACKGKEPKVRVRKHDFERLGRLASYLEDLSRDTVEYPSERGVEPSYKSFITDDEVDFDLLRGSGTSGGKYRIYLYFNEPHSMDERIAFLKNEYGTGGGGSALGGAFDASSNHDAKGIVLSKGNLTKPYDTVTLSWSVVARRLENLIQDGKYLSDKEIENLPNFERNLLATEIYTFFSDMPLAIERPHSMGTDYYQAIDDLAETLKDRAAVERILDSMRLCMDTLDEKARGYAHKKQSFIDVTRFASGVSLFDFEARKREWEQIDGEVQELAPVVSDGIAKSVSERGTEGAEESGYVQDEDDLGAEEVVPGAEQVIESGPDAVESGAGRYALDVKVGDTVVIGAMSYEVMGIENGTVFLNDVDFPLHSEEMAWADFEQLALQNPANEMFRVFVGEDRGSVVAGGVRENDLEGAKDNDGEGANENATGIVVENGIGNDQLSENYGNDRVATELSDETNEGFVDVGPSNLISRNEISGDDSTPSVEEPESVAEAKPAEKPAINRRTMPCRNYKLLKGFAEEVLSGQYTYMRFEKENYEPLYVELIGKNTIAMAHTYVQNGDLMYDPEMVISFDNEKEEIQAQSYELSSMGTYQQVADGEGGTNIGLQRELNSFLNQWLKNITQQERSLVRVIDREGDEIDLTKGQQDEPAVRDDVSEISADGDMERGYVQEDGIVSSVGTDVSARPGQVLPAFDFDGYLKVKELYPDDVIAYQSGDYYIFAGDDAERVAACLGLVLYSQNVGLEEDVVICGIPSGRLKQELDVLIQNGVNVAVHGLDKASGKVVTVDYESEMAPSLDANEHGVDAGLADGERLVFAPEAEPRVRDGRRNSSMPKSLSRETAVDYTIENLEHGSKSSKGRFRQNVDAVRLLKQIEAEERLATPEEQKVLAAYVGWGGLSEAFDDSKSAWASEYQELKDLLTPEEYSSAKASTLSAFYTSPDIIQFMYETLEHMGFKKGNILEPSCGVGNFIGMLPESLRDNKVYGVELDSVSGRIAQQLYQRQDIRVQGFEKTDFPDSFFDVAIGNVPFGQFKVHDRKFDKHNFLIHDYFFAKALDKVRPGGIVAFITSKGTMDKESTAVRKYLAERAELLGAVRLPNDAFKENAGTDVTSDIIFLQKREKPIEIDMSADSWVHCTNLWDHETGVLLESPQGELMRINSYFMEHPECILGEMEVESTQYGYDTTCKALPGERLADQLKGIRFTAKARLAEREMDEQESVLEAIPADPDVRNFSYALVDGKVYYRENSRMLPITFRNEDTENRVKALVHLRDSVRHLIEMQMEDYPESAIKQQREALDKVHDAFVKKYGLINDRKNRLAFESDSGYYLLASLENLDEDGKLKSKADIFYKRTIKPHVAVTSVDTSAEALEVSISEKARVDIPFMMELSGKSAEELEQDLRGVIFRVPDQLADDGKPVFVPADEYLSGNVREKLKVARKFAEQDEVYASNVSSLEMVQPKDLDASEISVRLGSTWIPTEYVDQFMYQLLDTPSWAREDASYGIHVKFEPVTGEWFIENKNNGKYGVKANTTYGSERISAYKIIEDTLNLRDARVYDYVEDAQGRKKAVLNREETTIAQQKQEIIKEAFVEWIWQDPDRRDFLTSYYNEHFNNIRPREYDGSHLSFGGINPEITLRKHQLNAIARVLYGGNALLAHSVGAGKTFEMVAAAQESKRLGLCSKSMFVVPNHLIEQFAADYMRLYPSANILCSTKKDFEPANRKKFCSRIATGDYDAIIIGHSQFEKIPMSVEGQKRELQAQLDEILAGIMALKEDKGERFSVKQLEKTKKTIEAKLEKLNETDRKDDVVTFEELGVDRLFVDEAHYYKNLFLYTKMRNVAGIGSREAQKSSDLFMKCRYLDKLTGGKGVIFATGTPISNSMTELYTMQRYLQYDLLCKIGMQHFDSWASTFGETVTAIELAPEGTGYRAKTRFARFNNLPELMATFKEMADVQTADMLHLPVPKANYHTVALPPSEIQKEMVQELAERAKDIHDRKVNPTEDNMLLVTNDGRKLALDQRLIDPLFGDHPNSKVNACADRVFHYWQDHADTKATQLVFCDLSTPKSGEGFDVYNDLKGKLVEKGIPENEIAFIHNYNTEQQKKALFESVRKGKVRVLMGSTQKMGTGTNVQDLLKALHDLDCPWRPSDLEQRLGRGVRQGNTNDEVDIFRYVQQDTFDAYLYQLVENKQNFISQIMTSKSLARSAEDVDEAVLTYAEIKSMATGDPRIKEKMDLDISVKRLKLLKQSYLRERYSLEDKILKTFPKDIAYYTDAIAKCKRDVALADAQSSTDNEHFFPMTIDGKTYTDKGEAGDALIEACRSRKHLNEETVVGDYRGFQLSIVFDYWKQTYKLAAKGELRYSVALGPDKFGNITRINNLLASLPERLKDFENRLSDTQVQLVNAKKQLEKPFAHEKELKEKSARLDQLNIELSLDKDSSIDISSSLDESAQEAGRGARHTRDEER